jgi:hypothetical protein
VEPRALDLSADLSDARFRTSRLALAGAALLLTAGLLPAAAGAQSDWVGFTDETSTRIVADAAVSTTDTEEKDLISGDFDKDGDTDLIVVRKTPFTNAGARRNVLFMNEDGVMTDRTATLAPDFLDATDDRDVIVADVDDDGWLDVVTGTTFGEQPRILMNLGEDLGGNWLGLDFNAADGRIPTISPGPHFCALAAGDITGDGVPELYFVDYDNTTEDRLLINDGNGFFTDETSTRMTTAMSNSVFATDTHIVDVNGDTFNDIVKNNASGSNPPPGFDPVVTVAYNDGTGNFTAFDTIYSGAGYMIEPADFNGDGRLDFFVVDDGQDAYLINTGNNVQGRAQFSEQSVTSSPSTAFFGGNVKFADLDQDDVLDVLIADVDTDIPGCSRRFVALRGKGPKPNVTYSDPLAGATRPWTPQGVYDVEALDVNGDGVMDLWFGTCTGTQLFLGISREIFTDGFEGGSTGSWTSTVP